MNALVERCPSRRTLALCVPLALAGWLLAGCGGSEDLVANTADTAGGTLSAPVRVATDFRTEPDHGPGDRPGGVLSERGTVDVGQGRSSEPVDPAARTRRGLYLSRSLAERVDAERRGEVVWIDAGCCASAAPKGGGLDLAVKVAFAVQTAKDAGPEVPFLVFGSDLRQAARLVDLLVASGAPNTYLVTP